MPDTVVPCLVVDDEPRLRRVLVRLLESDGFSCREAGSGVEALLELERQPVPLVISDLRMPQMDGFALLREIVVRWPDTAVVVVTAVADVTSAVTCLQLGALDYVGKPFNLDEVRARVRQALEKRRLRLEVKEHQHHLEERVQQQARIIEDLYLGGVEALAEALEAKDAYLRGHSRRVAEYSVSIAKQLGLAAAEIDTLALGAHLHDIGKIGVREDVLHKPGPLTEDEYRHIMEHPVIGARILGPLLKNDPALLAIVRSHHERLDGKGLPDGLAGDQIPPLVRIVTVADAFDAMTSERPYRHSLPVARALDELRNSRGSQFAPDVADAFLSAFPRPEDLPIRTPAPAPLTGPLSGLKRERAASTVSD
jgi:response regulator RpfG family c-di-GMP phosphodiesterase